MRNFCISLGLLFTVAACGGSDTPDQPDAAPPDDADTTDADTTDAPPPPPDAMVDAITVETNCNDGLDEDMDGMTDCLDSDCAADPECVPETMCADGIDNEGDGEADCLDDDCNGVAGCEFGAEATCDDVFDNDGDGLTDCEDPDCDGVSGCRFTGEATCDDGFDNDADGATDCADADCNGIAGCESPAELTCGDAFDNDADGDTDCADLDCDTLAGCEFGTELTCADGNDNDADGATDCADADCDTIGTCEFGSETTCDDGLDNDADGAADCADADCDTIGLCEFGSEASCADGFDNDGDGVADCLDLDCDTIGICEFGVELTCGDGLDNDGDGAIDCPDTNCAIAGLCLTGCPAGSTVLTLDATDLPQAILDSTNPVTVSNVTAPTGGAVWSAAVRIDLVHTYDADLDISLTSPSGAALNLSSDNGSNGDNYTQTYLTDLGPGVIGTAGFNTAPFTGFYRPEQAFSTLAGALPGGTWSLIVDDDLGGDVGTLNTFTLYLCTCDGIAGCERGEACRDGVSNDDDADVDCADTADCATDPFCIPEAICNDGIDQDLDGLIDCDDANCTGISGCEFGTEVTCDDLFDNDSDGVTDCYDADCASAPGCLAELICGDGLDNDADGPADCADSDCNGIGVCEFGAELTCDDLIDNDADSDVDCDDPDCASDPWCMIESNCGDALDNDGDGFADCADIGCDGVDSCEFGTEVSCTDGLDNDADGAADCADVDCAGVVSCIPIVCPPGATRTVLTATGLPVPIPDLSSTAATVDFAGAGVVLDLAVRVGVTHTSDSQIDLGLSSPAAVVRDLSSDNGGTGDNYVNTSFTDSAATAITAGTAPFTGAFRPEQTLAGYFGATAAGTWTLVVTDDTSGTTGTLDQFAMLLCTCDPASGECEYVSMCNDGLDNDGDGNTDCADANCTGDPRCAPEPDCDDTIDNDFDGAADCDDLDCNGISGCEFGTEVSCADTFDNDSDAAADCFDTDCMGTPTCMLPETACTDGFDNDADGTADCADGDCAGALGCEIEPNNTYTTANDYGTTAFNNRIRAAISPAADEDWFMFVVPAGGDVFFMADTFDNSGGQVCATPADTSMSLYDSTGTTVIESDTSDGEGNCARIIRVLPPGTYYVRVTAATTTATFAYQLYLGTLPMTGLTAETEPNEDGAVSTSSSSDGNDYTGAITPNGPFSSDVVITGAISPAGDEDMFTLTNPGASPVNVVIETLATATPASGAALTCSADTQVRLRDPVTPEPEAAYDDDDGQGTCSLLYYTLAAGATLNIHLQDFFDDGSISAYHLFVDFR